MSDFGLKQTKSTLWTEASLSSECKICDNIDLDTIYLDFCSYYHLRFGKLPKILKRIEGESNDSTKGKINNKARSSENSTKLSEEYQKKLKKESSELSSDDLVVKTSSISNQASESHNNDKNTEGYSLLNKYRNINVDLIENFSGEMRDMAYVIERFVRK